MIVVAHVKSMTVYLLSSPDYSLSLISGQLMSENDSYLTGSSGDLKSPTLNARHNNTCHPRTWVVKARKDQGFKAILCYLASSRSAKAM